MGEVVGVDVLVGDEVFDLAVPEEVEDAGDFLVVGVLLFEVEVDVFETSVEFAVVRVGVEVDFGHFLGGLRADKVVEVEVECAEVVVGDLHVDLFDLFLEVFEFILVSVVADEGVPAFELGGVGFH